MVLRDGFAYRYVVWLSWNAFVIGAALKPIIIL